MSEVAGDRGSLYSHLGGLEQLMRLIPLFISIGLGLYAPADTKGDETAALKKLPTVDRAFSISQDLSLSDDRMRLERRLATAPPEDIPLRDELASRYNELPAYYLFDLADRTFSNDVRAALEWYWIGYIRAGLDAAVCADTTAVDAVAYLPVRARTVSKYIRENPNVAGEVGEDILTRSDLRSSTVSPWWICSRGMSAKASGGAENALAWLAAEADINDRYTALMTELAETFRLLKQPMEDPVPALKPAIVPKNVVSERSITNVLWSNTKGLVLTEAIPRKPGRLLVWKGNVRDGKGGNSIGRNGIGWNENGLETLADNVGGPFVCLAGDYISYRTRAPVVSGGLRKQDPSAPKTLRYNAGTLGAELQEYSHQYAGAGEGVGISIGGFQRARVSDTAFATWSQSSLTCKWGTSSELSSVSYDAAKTVALGLGRGFLESTTEGTFHYTSPAAAPTKISEKQFPLKCMKFVPFLNAVNMVACPIAYGLPDGKEVNRNLLGVFLLKLDGLKSGGTLPVIEDAPLPLLHNERDETQTLITKAGIIRLMKSRYTPVRKRPGGLYWFGWSPDHEPKKIWEGYPDQADVSADGCTIAFSTIKSAASIGLDRNVLAIDVCDALLK